TNNKGEYEFRELRFNRYVVRQMLLSDVIQTAPPDNAAHEVELTEESRAATDRDFGAVYTKSRHATFTGGGDGPQSRLPAPGAGVPGAGASPAEPAPGAAGQDLGLWAGDGPAVPSADAGPEDQGTWQTALLPVDLALIGCFARPPGGPDRGERKPG